MTRHEKMNKIKELKIREQDAQIQENLVKFCKLLHDNESDRMKAKQRCQEEMRNNMKKLEEKEQIERDLIEEKQNREKIEKKLLALKKYDEYLNRVTAEHHDLYSTKADIIARHETLRRSNEKLEISRENTERKLELLKKQYVEYEKEKVAHLLKLNNEIATLQREIEVVNCLTRI